MADINEQTPPRVSPQLKSAPKIRQLYWCDFPKDAQLPEFWKRRPVIVISYRNTLHGTVTAIPCSTQDQQGNKWAYLLKSSIDGRKAWAICDKPTTLAVSRLLQTHGDIIRISDDEFNDILSLLLMWLPKLP